MKLNNYLLREAVVRRDIPLIIGIFAEQFPLIARRTDREWKLELADWINNKTILLLTPIGSASWYCGKYHTSITTYSSDGTNRIVFSPELFREADCILPDA